jgi:enolase
MVIVKEVSAKVINDSRGEKTIEVKIKTNVGVFSASSPQGKSTGKNAVKVYKKDPDKDVKKLNQFSDYFQEDIIENFDDLKRIEDIIDGHVGANGTFALESAVVKALAKENKKEVWEFIMGKDSVKKINFPRLVGNCVGGGKHSEEIEGKKPDFQEFEIIPNKKTVEDNFESNKKSKEQTEQLLKEKDEKFLGKKNDENAWMTSLNDKEVLDVLSNLKVPLGLDVAASGFCKRKKYSYQNPMLKRDSEEQFGYLANLIKNYNLFYIEDPFDEEDFESHALLLKRFPNSLIVGDDLIVTSSKRLKKAIDMKAVNAIIVKPNQCGSLLEVKRVVELAKENNIALVFSHRSGETDEAILADLAVGFKADFFKCGTEGDVRIKKIERLIEIEKSIK